MISLELSGSFSSRSLASSFSISCPSAIASPAQSYHRRASFTNSFPTIQCRISDQRRVSSAAPLPTDQSLPTTPVPIPVLHGFDTGLRIFSGTANPALSQEIACYLGLSLGKIKITWCDVELLESVEGCNVFLVQPTCHPVDENLMELNFMIDACRKAFAKDITVVIPYFGYSRADKPNQGRESITSRLVSKLIARARADRVIACDLHSEHLLGFFDIPINNIYVQPVILDYLASKSLFPNDLVVVSPDAGGVKRARAFAKKMSDAPLAIIEKRRSAHNVAEAINLFGDVRGKVAVMVDDIIDTAGTMAKGAALLQEAGAREVYACSTHAVFSPPSIERLSSGLFQEVITTNTISNLGEKKFPQLTVLSVANLIAEVIWRIHNKLSVSSLFQ